MDVMAAPPSADGPMTSVKQCLTCMRWVAIELHSVGPVGADPMCGLCLAVSELQAAIGRSRLSNEREEAVHQAIWRAHVLVTSCGRGTPSRPYVHLDMAEEETFSE